jgi:hypothetical protein
MAIIDINDIFPCILFQSLSTLCVKIWIYFSIDLLI